MNHVTTTTLSLCAALAVSTATNAEMLQVPGEFASIQEAIDAAQDGDQVVVGPGVYQESIIIGSRSLTLLASDGPEATFLEPGSVNNEHIILVGDTNTPSVHIEGFTLRHHETSYQGALAVYDCQLLVRNCHFSDCTNNYGGAAIRLAFYGYGDDLSDALIENCRFEGNQAMSSSGSFGGAISGLLGPDSLVHISQSQFSGNTAANGGHVAFTAVGGSPENSTTLTLDECTFDGGQAGHDGGAIYLTGSSSGADNWVHVGYSQLHDNHAAGADTAALHVGPNMNLDLHQTLVSGSMPGGVWISPEADAHVSDSDFCSNSAFDIEGDWLDWGGNGFSPSCACTGDTDGDGRVAVNDLLNLLAEFGGTDASYDLDENGQVDVGDVLIIIANWGECG